ncbi:hypothetical protein [Bdellovibrio bacteriovorus]|uniref:hypothetical protein n=1 Tax=Bdellovibrio bacteriovorus TaxID=959 RepID=UPI0035A6DCF2
MKKFSLILAISLGLSACAEKDSEFAQKIREKGKHKTAQAANIPDGKSFEICEKPAEIICGEKVSSVAESLMREGRQRALELLKKEKNLPENFDGSAEAFIKAFGQSPERSAAQDRLLILADQEYRSIYNYDEDLKEAGEIARKLLLNVIEKEKMDEDGRYNLIGAINTTVFQTVSETFETEYLRKDLVKIQMSTACGTDGLGKLAMSLLPQGGPNGVIFVCPGNLLLSAGKSKEERITRLVMQLGHELAHQLQFRGYQADAKALSCVTADNGASTSAATTLDKIKDETQADIIGYRVLNAYLANEKDSSVKADKAKAALNWICHMPEEKGMQHLDNASRVKNYFKMDETGATLSCSGGPRC